MPLRSVLVFSIWLLCALQLLSLFLYFNGHLAPSLYILEADRAAKDHERVIEALFDEQTELENFCRKWAIRDETYRYMQDQHPQYLSTSLNNQAFIDNRINLITLLDNDQRVIWSNLYDYSAQEPLIMPHLLANIWQTKPSFLVHSSTHSLHSGILMTDLGPMFLASSPILHSNNTGPIRGTLLVGRWLTPETIQSINDKTQTPAQFWPIGSKATPTQKLRLLNTFHDDTEFHVLDSDNAFEISSASFDIGGTPTLLISTSTGRPANQLIQTARNIWCMVSISAAIIGTLLIYSLIKHRIHNPLERVMKRLTKTIKGPLPAVSIPTEGPEFTPLARTINSIALAQHEWMQQESRKAYLHGMGSFKKKFQRTFEEHFQQLQHELQQLQQILRKMPVESIERIIAESLSHTIDASQQNALLEQLQQANTLLFDQQRTLHLQVTKITGKIANLLALSH